MAVTQSTKKHDAKLKGEEMKMKEQPVEETEKKAEEKKIEAKVEERKTEVKKEEAKKKVETKKPEKKDVAIANGFSLRVSSKHCFAICKIIRGKTPEAAVKRLEDVISGKRAVPMAGREVAHQKGKGLAGAKFPKNACAEIIGVINQAAANAVVVGVENPVITIAKADKASRPYRKAGRKAKRTHVHIEVRAKTEKIKKEARK